MKAKLLAALSGLLGNIVPKLAAFIAHKLLDPMLDGLIADAKAGLTEYPDLAIHAAEIAALETEIKAWIDAKLVPTPPAPPAG